MPHPHFSPIVGNLYAAVGCELMGNSKSVFAFFVFCFLWNEIRWLELNYTLFYLDQRGATFIVNLETGEKLNPLTPDDDKKQSVIWCVSSLYVKHSGSVGEGGYLFLHT